MSGVPNNFFGDIKEDEEEFVKPKTRIGSEEQIHDIIDKEAGKTEDLVFSEVFLPKEHTYKANKKSKTRLLASKAIILWFRLRCQGWSLESEMTHFGEAKFDNVLVYYAIFKTVITDPDGRVRSIGTKKWDTTKSAGDYFVECAETGSINRAILNLGFSAENSTTDFHPDGFIDGRVPFQWIPEEDREKYTRITKNQDV